MADLDLNISDNYIDKKMYSGLNISIRLSQHFVSSNKIPQTQFCVMYCLFQHLSVTAHAFVSSDLSISDCDTVKCLKMYLGNTIYNLKDKYYQVESQKCKYGFRRLKICYPILLFACRSHILMFKSLPVKKIRLMLQWLFNHHNCVFVSSVRKTLSMKLSNTGLK